MPEHLKSSSLAPPTQPLSQTQNFRDNALRRLSRSPHPYHRQAFELPHASEKFSTVSYAPPTKSPLCSRQNTDDEGADAGRVTLRRSDRTPINSDSGTEADDEHFLKGLPAPKVRPHKGLRRPDGALSGSPSPLWSPAILDEATEKEGFLTKASLATVVPEDQKAAKKFKQKRTVEVIRRVTETGILGFVGGLLCLDPEMRRLIWLWRKELVCQSVIVGSLISIYPFRLLRHINPARPWQRPFPIAIPATFDPAPLLYPPIITVLASLVLSASNPVGLLPSIVLSISSLPRRLIPSLGGPESSNIAHWFLSCLPILIPKLQSVAKLIEPSQLRDFGLDHEALVMLYPLHQALCDTLQYLTTTSLLPAELQLLSAALIQLLLLGSSPQAVILKAILWGTGIGILVSCTHVLRWGVALARVPKWRFRRNGNPGKLRTKVSQKSMVFAALGSVFFAKDTSTSESSEDDEEEQQTKTRSTSPKLQLETRGTVSTNSTAAENGSVSAVDYETKARIANGSVDAKLTFTMHRRHTLPSLVHLPPKSSKRTPSGRRKRSTSSSVQSFFVLTQTQAFWRKWLYAAYVYICVLAIILVGIRDHVGRFALAGNEPVGWALGYLFGNLPHFRMEVVKANLQRWIILPPRNDPRSNDFCHLGWVEHLRQTTIGTANTRLVLCGYWLSVIIVGLAIVFRLSAIYEVDTRRKVFHFMMVAMLLPATFVDPTFAALALSLMLAIFLLLDLFRAAQLPPLSKHLAYFLTPYVDGRDLKGPVVISHIFLLIGCAIPLWLSLGSLARSDASGWEVPQREVSMVSGVICVGMGDAAASLIGRRYGRRKWIWGGGKSVEGSAAFATAVAFALILSKAWLRVGGWPANNVDEWYITIGKAGVAAWVASLTEAVLTGGNDNVVVPVVLWLCVKGLDI